MDARRKVDLSDAADLTGGGMPREACLIREDGRAVYEVRESLGTALVEVLTLPTEQEAEKVLEARLAWRNLVSLQRGMFLEPIEVRRDGCRVTVRYEPCDGLSLTQYLRETFGEYMADEEFALELCFVLADELRGLSAPTVRLGMTRRLWLHDVWLTPEGRVRLLPPTMETTEETRQSERLVTAGLGEMLYAMLTRHDPRGLMFGMLACREVNQEISTSAETVVRRCAQGVEGGGFGSLASLRQTLQEVLRTHNSQRALGGGVLQTYRGEKPRIAYRSELKAAVRTETRYLAALREHVMTRGEELILRLFKNTDKAGLRPMWIPIVGFYLLLVSPFLMSRLPTGTVITWMGILFLLYVAMFASVYASYRRRHR